jgi:hypothetical protein
MAENSAHEREARAARNQALFRAVNEKLRSLNDTFVTVSETFVIACECADTSCIEMLTIRPEDYEAVRAKPRQFFVLRGHVYPELEREVGEFDDYVVVEKFGEAGRVAEETASDDGSAVARTREA